VELYSGKVDANGELVEGHAIAMHPEGQPSDGLFHYAVETSITQSGLHGITVRVRPSHSDLPVSFVPGLICWADPARVAEPALV
jgi:starch phosphorylase